MSDEIMKELKEYQRLRSKFKPIRILCYLPVPEDMIKLRGDIRKELLKDFLNEKVITNEVYNRLMKK